MKQLELTETVSFRWWRPDGKDIIPEHVEPLKEHARAHIQEMHRDGYIMGVLEANMCLDEDEPWVEYKGSWTVGSAPMSKD